MSGRTHVWRRWLVIVLALAGMASTFSLGRWQLSRADEKRALQALVAERQQQPLLDGASLVGALSATQLEALRYRAISLQGKWLPERTVYLDNRSMDQRAGFYVLTPLHLLGHETVVLVQRGWAPRDFADRLALPEVATPAGTVRISGRIAERASRVYALGEEGRELIRQNLDLDAFRVETGLPLAPVVVWQTGAPSDGLLRQWPEPSSGLVTHQGYAFQWFGLCALIGLLFVWFQVVRPVFRSPGR